MARNEKFSVLNDISLFNQDQKTEPKLTTQTKQVAEEPVNKTEENKTADFVEETISQEPVDTKPVEHEPEKKEPVYHFNIIPAKKETKSVKKSFLFLPSIDKKLNAMAKECGRTPNDLVNEILKQFFESQE